MKEESMDDILVNNVCSHSLGIMISEENNDNFFSKIIKNGTNIPYEMEKIIQLNMITNHLLRFKFIKEKMNYAQIIDYQVHLNQII